jgi:hypothetical protein
MFYTIYKITNQIDGKFYIGSHKTKDLNDVYMGSGKYLIHAQKKYGIENFKKEILFVFETADEMYAKEAEIVNEDFLATENTYNLKIGGFGGWDYINRDPSRYLEQRKRNGAIVGRDSALKTHERWSTDASFKDKRRKAAILGNAKVQEKYPNGTLFGKTHTVETKLKIGESTKVTSRGERNSQYGTRWIHSLDEKKSKKIEKDTPLPEGWLEGRKMKF